MIGLLSLCFEHPFAVARRPRPVHGGKNWREDRAASVDPHCADEVGRRTSR
jgi:hypothetical protein